MAKKEIPKWMEGLLTVAFIFYVWYLGSTLLLPLANIIKLPNFIFITLYHLVEYPPSILGFIVCVSIISTIVILSEFKNQKPLAQVFLIEGLTFLLYFIIPILATIFLLVFVLLQVSGQLPTETTISYFLEDLFIFTSILFILTGILNLVMHKIIKGAAEPTPISSSKDKFKY